MAVKFFLVSRKEILMIRAWQLPAAALILSVSGGLSAADSASATDQFQRKVSVSGTAVINTVPDIVVWTLTTSDFSEDLLKAKEKSDAKLKAIIALKEALGVQAEDLQTGQLSIRREYDRDSHGNPTRFKHFAVTRTVTVRQRDVKRFDEYLSKFVATAEVEVNFHMESSRFHELRIEARRSAVKIAREKAAQMTQELGAKLGKVLTIDEETPRTRSSYWESNIASNTMVNDTGDSSAADATQGTFAPGSIEIRVTVSASFAIE